MLTNHLQEDWGFVKPVRAIVTVRVSINNDAIIFEVRLKGWCSHDPRFMFTLHFNYLTLSDIPKSNRDPDLGGVEC